MASHLLYVKDFSIFERNLPVTTKSPDEPNAAPQKGLLEIPRFFEKPSVRRSSAASLEGLESGEAQFREDFQARWWPGDLTTQAPPPKG